MTEQIKKALLELDPKNDDHWTGDGLPRMDKMGIPGLKRGDITAAAPQFTRDNPTFETADPDAGKSDEDLQKKDEDPDAGKDDTAGNAAATPPAPEQEGEELPEDEYEALKVQHEKALKVVEKAHADVDAAQEKLRQAQRAADAIGDQMRDMTSHRTTQHDIMDYIESQKRLREQRAEMHRQSIPVHLRSPLDNAMSRKNIRGGQRPVRDVSGKV